VVDKKKTTMARRGRRRGRRRCHPLQ